MGKKEGQEAKSESKGSPQKKIAILNNNKKGGQIDNLKGALKELGYSHEKDYDIIDHRDAKKEIKKIGKDEKRKDENFFKDYNVIISSGSGMAWKKSGDNMELKDSVHKHIKEKSKDKYVLGVCHGAQALGEAYGANVTNSGYHHRKRRPIKPKHALFKGKVKKEDGYHANHKYYIRSEDASGLEIIAESLSESKVKGREGEKFVDAYKVGKHYGVQFHPEKTAQGKEFLKRFLYKATGYSK